MLLLFGLVLERAKGLTLRLWCKLAKGDLLYESVYCARVRVLSVKEWERLDGEGVKRFGREGGSLFVLSCDKTRPVSSSLSMQTKKPMEKGTLEQGKHKKRHTLSKVPVYSTSQSQAKKDVVVPEDAKIARLRPGSVGARKGRGKRRVPERAGMPSCTLSVWRLQDWSWYMQALALHPRQLSLWKSKCRPMISCSFLEQWSPAALVKPCRRRRAVETQAY